MKIEQKIYRYFEGKLSETEKKDVEAWKNESEENLNIFNEIKKVFHSVDLLNEMNQYDSGVALKKVKRRTGRTGRMGNGWIYRVAAVIIISLLLGDIWLRFNSNVYEEETFQTLKVPEGMRSQIKLPDGTDVWLNSGSELMYSSLYLKGKRELKLMGEAYFKVFKDSKHPFVVSTGDVAVRVTGTEFNIENYRDEDEINVVLSEGSVEFISNNSTTKLSPGFGVVYNKSDKTHTKSKVETFRHSAWKDGMLVFMDDEMSRVAKDISRWFNVEIEINDDRLLKYIYTATFEKENLTEVMELLKLSAPIDYRVIKPKKNSDGSFTKQKLIIYRTK